MTTFVISLRETCENVSQIMWQTVILASLRPSLALLCAFVCTTWAHASKCCRDCKRAGSELWVLYRYQNQATSCPQLLGETAECPLCISCKKYFIRLLFMIWEKPSVIIYDNEWEDTKALKKITWITTLKKVTKHNVYTKLSGQHPGN